MKSQPSGHWGLDKGCSWGHHDGGCENPASSDSPQPRDWLSKVGGNNSILKAPRLTQNLKSNPGAWMCHLRSLERGTLSPTPLISQADPLPGLCTLCRCFTDTRTGRVFRCEAQLQPFPTTATPVPCCWPLGGHQLRRMCALGKGAQGGWLALPPARAQRGSALCDAANKPSPHMICRHLRLVLPPLQDWQQPISVARSLSTLSSSVTAPEHTKPYPSDEPGHHPRTHVLAYSDLYLVIKSDPFSHLKYCSSLMLGLLSRFVCL